MPRSPRISSKSCAQNHHDMHQTMCQDMPQACAKTSKISLICQNLQDMPQTCAITSKICLKAYTKTSKIQASKYIEEHTFQHVNNLVHEISDIHTFLNFNIKKNTFLKTFLSLMGLDRATGGALCDDTRTTSGVLAGHPILDPHGGQLR
jgi:hypothetical protein